MAFLTGIFASMGLGGGMVLIVYLTVFAGFSQIAAQGINLVFFIPIAIISLVLIIIMLVLTVTSFQAVRKKMKAKKWKQLQRTAYVFYGFVGNGCCCHISMACKQDRAKPAFKSFRYFPYPNGTERVIFQE